jgi:uncharacterized protein (DUF2384 family)
MVSGSLEAFERIAHAWSLSEDERVKLLGIRDIAELRRLRGEPSSALPTEVLERIEALLQVYQAINILLQQPARAHAWMRKPNRAPAFGGKSAMNLMLDQGVDGIRSVRSYLQAEVWAS